MSLIELDQCLFSIYFRIVLLLEEAKSNTQVDEERVSFLIRLKHAWPCRPSSDNLVNFKGECNNSSAQSRSLFRNQFLISMFFHFIKIYVSLNRRLHPFAC